MHTQQVKCFHLMVLRLGKSFLSGLMLELDVLSQVVSFSENSTRLQPLNG